MQKLLDQRQIGILREKYHDEPLLLASRRAFLKYEETMVTLLVAPEDIFMVTLELLDTVRCSSSFTQKDAEELWSNLIIDIRRNWKSDASQEERNIVAGVVFYLLAATFGLYWHKDYCESIRNNFLNTITERLSVSIDEELRIIKCISEHAEDLSVWINEYVDSDCWLAKDVYRSINKNRIIAKTVDNRKKKEEIIKTSFNYNPDKVDNQSKNIRITEIFNRLKVLKLIDNDSNLKEFLQLFSGEEVTVKIVWTGNDNVLHYLFDEWVNKRKYVPKPKGGLWKTVAARFCYKGKDKEGSFYDESYTADELRKTANPTNPSDDYESLLELLKPNIRVRRYDQ